MRYLYPEVPARDGWLSPPVGVLLAGPTYVAADGGARALAVPVVATVPPGLRIGDGWQRVETWDGVGMGRWLRGEGEAHLESLGGRAVTLRFLAVSFARPRTLEVRLGGELLAVAPVGVSPAPVTVTVPPGRDRATVTFEAREGVNSRDQADLDDKRPLTIGLAEIEVAP
jgi:hypothetical protein